jgi:hypothetical protein
MNVLPGIPNGTMLFRVEVVFYGPPRRDQIGVRPVVIKNVDCWAKSSPEANNTVKAHFAAAKLELISIVSTDPAKGRVVRETIINDSAFDPEFHLITHEKPEAVDETITEV